MMERTISQDEMRKMLHISKRKAKYLLDEGIIPCVNTGKLTRQYRVNLSDVEEYLKHPYVFEVGMFTMEKPKKASAIQFDETIAQAFYQELWCDENDMLTVNEICELIGYSRNTLYIWMKKGWVERHFLMNRMYVSKQALIKMVSSVEYMSIVHKSDKHQAHIWAIMKRCADM